MFNTFGKLLLGNGLATAKSQSRVNLYENIDRCVKKYQTLTHGETLNIGSGGEIERTLKDAGGKPISIDVDPERGPDIVGSIENMSMFHDAKFSAVFCFEVLEHVQDPFSAAKEILRVLQPGGLLIGSTPFMLGVHDAPHDYFRYTRYGLRHLFKEFEPVELIARNRASDASAVLLLRLYVVGAKDDRVKLAIRWPFVKVLITMQAFLMRGISNDDATTGYFFVFRKPLKPALKDQ